MQIRKKFGTVMAASGMLMIMLGAGALPAQGAERLVPSLQPSPRPAINPVRSGNGTAVQMGHVTGTVIDQRTGAPTAGVSVTIGGVTVTTDANGTIISRRPDPERWFGTKVSSNVREAMRVILMTEPGERLRLPEFGAGLGRFLFEPNILSTHTQMRQRIADALKRWEPRIRVAQVEVIADPRDAQAALATITYRLVSSGQQATMNLNVPVAS